MLVMLAMFSSVNALTLNANQDDNIYNFNIKEKGNYLIQDLVGSINHQYNINNTNYTYDLDLEFSSVNEEFFIVIQNQIANSTLTFMYRGDLTRNGNLYIQELHLTEQGKYYFRFVPNYIGEPARIYIDISTTGIGTIEVIEQKPQGFNNLIGVFVGSFQEIISINLGLWRMTFYMIVLGITITFIFGLFGVGFYILKKAKHIREKGFN